MKVSALRVKPVGLDLKCKASLEVHHVSTLIIDFTASLTEINRLNIFCCININIESLLVEATEDRSKTFTPLTPKSAKTSTR